MAKRLHQSGDEVFVYDIDSAKMKPHAEIGIHAMSSSAEVARMSDFIITCVVDPKSVEEAVLGKNGVMEGARAGTVLIETTSSSPFTTRKIAEKLKEKNVDVIDAPVSRGVPAAENGTLSIMVGGDEEVLQKCLPVLRKLGTDIFHVGGLGAGHVVKALNMLLLGAHLIAAAEVVALGIKQGLDPRNILEVINVSSGENFMTSNHFLKYVLPKTYDSKFTVDLMLKDIRIGTEIARELGLPSISFSRVEEIYTMAAAHGLGAEDNTKLVPFIESLMGVDR
jgi:3-hydroxyisobutyrate dehydrogenase-like beta-hydroxyacid dehydrogenase